MKVKPYIFAIDPGSAYSAFVGFRDGKVESHGKIDNNELVIDLSGARHYLVERLVVEFPEPRGQPTSREEMETLYWIGRFHEAAACPLHRIYRRQVKMNLCGNMARTDSNIRQAIIDRFGGKAAIGKKKTPGPLYGIKADEWQALAVALTFSDVELPKLQGVMT